MAADHECAARDQGAGEIEPCDDQSCPTGCCNDQGECEGGTQDIACGTGGVNCEDCTQSSMLCEAQSCQDLGSCNQGETRDCGNCGTRTCTFDGEWGSCEDQGECAAGFVEIFGSCGNCGKLRRVCDAACEWGSVECTDEGECEPNEVETAGSCGTCGTDQRVCDPATCMWGPWECVEVQDCTPGQTEQGGSCGNCGTEERQCGADCTWGNWNCTNEGECEPDSTSNQGCAPCQLKTCTQQCTWGPCELASEVCNGLDDDCDSICDNGFQCCMGTTGPCNTSCGSVGTHTCLSGTCTWGNCNPPPETCNGMDDDCNSQTDEGDRADNISTTYTVMSGFNSTCNGSAERWGMNCNGAIHDWCRTQTCSNIGGQFVSGFGPVENIGDSLTVTCVAGVSVQNVTFATLQQHHNQCVSGDPLSGPCYAAIKRYCQSQGFSGTGFGPVSSNATSAEIVCVTAGNIRNTTYTVMSSYISNCDGTTERIGSACNAAIKRFCRDQGDESGFGPVENVGNDLVVVCVYP